MCFPLCFLSFHLSRYEGLHNHRSNNMSGSLFVCLFVILLPSLKGIFVCHCLIFLFFSYYVTLFFKPVIEYSCQCICGDCCLSFFPLISISLYLYVSVTCKGFSFVTDFVSFLSLSVCLSFCARVFISFCVSRGEWLKKMKKKYYQLFPRYVYLIWHQLFLFLLLFLYFMLLLSLFYYFFFIFFGFIFCLSTSLVYVSRPRARIFHSCLFSFSHFLKQFESSCQVSLNHNLILLLFTLSIFLFSFDLNFLLQVILI